MNDDHSSLEQMKQEHRRLDDQIRALTESGDGDQLELARLKKRKLRLKDEIQLIMDASVPDIIA
ncbi:DUF465 domain-containing protein [Sphingomonas piscis]|uniref:DUF465 domain-containing protein n=1 Tax=Sphingomonas piscis TaxID=2714943 RepID=A0A6G7YSC3_9SPHN|nr:DUF465 domain-containing protein [Sphingomonas piscis]QIK79645.1 DUF465 domain-containing protein [Sphingomonas piscis]